MTCMLDNLNGGMLALPTLPERVKMTQQHANTPVDMNWLWIVLLFIAVIAAASAVWLVVSLLINRRKAVWSAFNRHCDQLGLAEEERHLLQTIAANSGLARVDLIFTSSDGFARGVAAVTTDNSPGGWLHSSARLCGTCSYIQTLREKLGFITNVDHGQATTVSLGKIPQGSVLSVVRQKSPTQFQAVVVSSSVTANELVLQAQDNVDLHIGDSWMLRFPEGGILWEFNGWVIRNDGGKAVVRPSGSLRWINRRKFVRTPTDKAAFLASFPFSREQVESDVPEFSTARLVEIAGPGLQFRTQLITAVSERLLVVVQLRSDKRVEGVGMVRHVSTDENGDYLVGLELTGLSTSEISDLAKETTIASTEEEAASYGQLV